MPSILLTGVIGPHGEALTRFEEGRERHELQLPCPPLTSSPGSAPEPSGSYK
jgi:hypothetical protein